MIRRVLREEHAMASARETLATQVDAAILSALREIAQREGRQLESLVDEALTDLVEKRRNANVRAHVMDAYLASHATYSELYKKLAE
jgi:hypothetical protein